MERLRRFVLNTSPEHADARADLMAEYNTSVKRLNEVKSQDPDPTDQQSLSLKDVPELMRRTWDVQALWTSPRRTNEERKRLLQTIVSEVIARNVTLESADLEVVWKSGARTTRAHGMRSIMRQRRESALTAVNF